MHSRSLVGRHHRSLWSCPARSFALAIAASAATPPPAASAWLGFRGGRSLLARGLNLAAHRHHGFERGRVMLGRESWLGGKDWHRGSNFDFARDRFRLHTIGHRSAKTGDGFLRFV